MRLVDFQYDLPKRLIAQSPAERRTGSRLMIVDRARQSITHSMFENLIDYLNPGDCLVFNNTRVIPARLYGRKEQSVGMEKKAAGVKTQAFVDGVNIPAEGSFTCAAEGALKFAAEGAFTCTAKGAFACAAEGARVEALLIREANAGSPDISSAGSIIDSSVYSGYGGAVWEAITRPAKRLQHGARIAFGDGELRAVVAGVLPEGHRLLRFNKGGEEFTECLYKIGRTPLPPYIKNRGIDPERYQTVYSKIPGSAAAPTAGLHFTDEYLRKLADAQINAAYLTLHVGPGTFAPVKAENIEEHRMHSEYYNVSAAAAEQINRVKIIKKSLQTNYNGNPISLPRVVSVGTTSLRTLESVAGADGLIHPCEGCTDIFIYPGYAFKCVDALLTNFHLPGSTLLMLICAFTGYDLAMEAYRRAVETEYRFFSFGDAMLII